MTTIRKFHTRAAKVEAMRVIVGVTTRTAISSFCPGANVGYLSTDKTDRDIRWVYLPGGAEVTDDGDWIVKVSESHFIVLSDAEFNRRYEVA